jgi:ABC-type methionine transport system permease subunit
VLRSESIGPFNKELTALVGAGLQEAFGTLVKSGPFVEIAVIHKSAMAGSSCRPY